jgi:glycerophosphoryl diester phosphodiesterase
MRAQGLTVISAASVAAAHSRNVDVHAWTINTEADMRAVIDMGVDGIITDYPTRLMGLVGR